MTIATTSLGCAAVLALVLGFESWRLTSSGKVRLNTLIGTAALAYAAYLSIHPAGVAKAITVAFIVGMLFGGYAIGLFFRSRQMPEMRRPSFLLAIVSAAALLGAAVTYWQA